MLTLLAPASAGAFEREVTDTTRVPLYWSERVIPLQPANDTSEDLTSAEVQTAIVDALHQWETAGGCTDLRFDILGEPANLETNLTSEQRDNRNKIVWREDEWMGSPEALAVTTLVYRRTSGQIVDADIDVNGVDFDWTSAVTTATINDAQNTLTHEFGHLIGLAHTPVAEATMFGSSPEGEITKRDLADDDVDAVCFVYPAGRTSPTNLQYPSGLTNLAGCDASGEASPSAALFVMALLIAGGVFARRRRPL